MCSNLLGLVPFDTAVLTLDRVGELDGVLGSSPSNSANEVRVHAGLRVPSGDP